MSPWDRLPAENEEAYRAFLVFRDQVPPRRLRALTDPVTCLIFPAAQVSRWATEHDWRRRAEAWDAHLQATHEQTITRTITENAEAVANEHKSLLATARDLVGRELQKLVAKSEGAGGSALKPTETVKLLDAVIKYDRLVRGETTSNAGRGRDLSRLSVDELRALKELENKIEGESEESETPEDPRH